MSIEQKLHTQEEFEQVKRILEDMGIPYEQHSPFITFSNGDGECVVFPSQTYDDKLVVRYAVLARCSSARDALLACGVIMR